MLDEYNELIEDVVKCAHKFYDHGYEMSDGGNLSVRIPGRKWMLVKGTNVAFDEICADNLVITDFDGNIQYGSIKPSKEALLHGAIYKKLSEVNAIMHCHSPYAVAWAAQHDELGFATYHSAMKLGYDCPVFDTHSYAVPKESFQEILSLFDRSPEAKGFLLRGHGQVTIGPDIRKASYLAELVEETAKIAILSQL